MYVINYVKCSSAPGKCSLSKQERRALISSDHFSKVSFLDVIEHMEDPVASLKAALRIMLPGGALVLVVPNEKALLQRVVKTKHGIIEGCGVLGECA